MKVMFHQRADTLAWFDSVRVMSLASGPSGASAATLRAWVDVIIVGDVSKSFTLMTMNAVAVARKRRARAVRALRRWDR